MGKEMKIVSWRIIDVVKELGLVDGEYTVIGSAILEVLGIRKAEDVDIVFSRGLYKKLRQSEGWEEFYFDEGKNEQGIRHQGGEVNGFWYCPRVGLDENTVREMMDRAIDLDGVKFVSLEDTMKYKGRMGREKDLRDIEPIKQYMEEKI